MGFRIFSTCAACLVLSHGALAGPDATTNRFLTDSPSMMDWGLYRLEESLAKESLGSPRVRFDWDKNRIGIFRTVLVDALDVDAELNCKIWMSDVRVEAGVSPDGGGFWMPGMKASFFAQSFGHSGYTEKVNGVEEADALVELDRMFFLRIEYFAKEATGYVSRLACHGDLLSSAVAVEKH